MHTEIHRIIVQDTGAQFHCRGDEYILQAMLRAHCGPMHYGCCGGGCGVCKARVVKGMYRQDKSMSRAHVGAEEQKEGIVLLCCIKPCTNMVIMQV